MKDNKPDVFQESYKLWHKEYIKEDDEWVKKVNNNPFIAIESHINEDTITDLLAHILETDPSIKSRFLNFLLDKSGKKGLSKEDEQHIKIETQYSIQNKGKKSRLDLFITDSDQ